MSEEVQKKLKELKAQEEKLLKAQEKLALLKKWREQQQIELTWRQKHEEEPREVGR